MALSGLASVLLLLPGGGPASAANSITSPDDGKFPSLALDESGNPVVAYFDDTNDDLKILHCNDPDCAGGGDSITSPDTSGSVGWSPSLALDAAGNPVVSYDDYTTGYLKVLHCNDPNCAGGGDSITSPSIEGDPGSLQKADWSSSLALDALGNPVVSYFDDINNDLKVLHCNDANCAGGGESVTSPDHAGPIAPSISMALDAGGNPVVTYHDWTNGSLKVLHCNDANCAGGDESITSPDTVGLSTSLALDAAGNPVVSYHGNVTGDLKVLHCNDPNCAGSGESINSPDTEGDTGYATSLVLDGQGNPVVSYIDWPSVHLKILHCDNANCAAPAPTPTPGGSKMGDVDCSGAVNSVDALKILRYVANLHNQPVENCAPIGNPIPGFAAHGGQHYQGDVDCSGAVNSVDALKILRYVANLHNQPVDGCPPIGS